MNIFPIKNKYPFTPTTLAKVELSDNLSLGQVMEQRQFSSRADRHTPILKGAWYFMLTLNRYMPYGQILILAGLPRLMCTGPVLRFQEFVNMDMFKKIHL